MKRLFTLTSAKIVIAVCLLFITGRAGAQINPLNIDIVRDSWGVPHIYGKTDAEASYGLAWATCEDDFKTVQELLLAVRGRLGSVEGKSGAILDFMGFISGIDRVVDNSYDTAFSPHYKKIIEAYTEGLNAYASSHTNEVFAKKLFPVSCKDIIKQYVLTNVLLTSVYLDIQKIFQGYIKNYEMNMPSGSNAFALNSSRTKDGKTYLAINSHQPVEGLFSWYEAHMNSEEGMNILGGTFPGGMNIMLGANPNLGWACTLNHPDLDDVFKLDMNPQNELQYWFDDHWETLEVRKKTEWVKLGPVKLPLTKTFYWSKYGSTIKNDQGYYAIRFPANMDIRSPEQLYNMNKASSFTEWHNAMRMGSIPGINFIYADKTDTIFYASAAQLPHRNPVYNWKKVVPGNTSATLWSPNFYPFDSIPQVLNPRSGYIVNTNNSCFDVTGAGDNPDPGKYPYHFGYGLEKNNRSIMAHYLIGQHSKLSYDEFKQIKFNRSFNDSLYDFNLQGMITLTQLNPVKYPDLADAIGVVRSWNRECDINNQEVSLIVTAMYYLVDQITSRGTEYECNTFPEKEYVKALRQAKQHMLKHFGTLRVPLGQVQKLVRGNMEVGVGGIPEVLAASITEPYKNGMRKVNVGESYIELVRYSKEGVQIESVNAFGASAKPGSPHYTDQMQMYANQQLKTMTLDKASIYRDAEKIYHPVKSSEVTAGRNVAVK